MDDKYEITVVSYEDDNKNNKWIGIPLSQQEVVNYISDVDKIKKYKGKCCSILQEKNNVM